MSSVQVSTTSLLKQFATELGEGELAVTSKLGATTVSRVRFKKLDFPAHADDQLGFLQSLIEQEHPTAPQILSSMYGQCLNDQAKAVNTLLGK